MSALREPTSFTLVLRDRQAPAVERDSFRGPMVLRAGKRPAGSPGSTVFSDQAWNQIVGRLRLSLREGEIVRGERISRGEPGATVLCNCEGTQPCGPEHRRLAVAAQASPHKPLAAAFGALVHSEEVLAQSDRLSSA